MRKSFLIIVLSTFVCSCSQDNLLPVNMQEGPGINFGPARLNTAVTKGNAGEGLTYIPKDEKVGLSAYLLSGSPVVESTYSARNKEYVVKDDVGALDPTDGEAMRLMLKNNTTFKFYGYTPILPFISEAATKIVKIDNGVDFKIGDVVETIEVVSDVPQTVTLTPFKRKCSLAEYVVTCTPGKYIKETSVGEQGLTIGSLTQGPIEYTFGTPNIDVSAAAQTASLLLKQSQFVTPEGVPAGTKSIGAIPILPRTKSELPVTLDTKLKVDLKADGNITEATQTLKAKIPELEMLPGFKYSFSLLFCDPGVVLTLQVLPWTDVKLPADLGKGGGKITLEQWNNIINSNNQGAGSGTLTAKQWEDIVTNAIQEGVRNGSLNIEQWTAVLNLIKGGGALGNLTVQDWIVIVKQLLEMGLNSGKLSVDTWATTINGILSQGSHSGSFTISDWTSVISAIITEGIAKGVITPASLGNTITTVLSQGTPSGTITTVDWASTFTLIMAQGAYANNGITITDWNVPISYAMTLGYAKGLLSKDEWKALISIILEQGAGSNKITIADWASILSGLGNVASHNGTGLVSATWAAVIKTILSQAAATGKVTVEAWLAAIVQSIQQGNSGNQITIKDWPAIITSILTIAEHNGTGLTVNQWTKVIQTLSQASANGKLTNNDWLSVLQSTIQLGVSKGTISAGDWTSLITAIISMGTHTGTGLTTSDWIATIQLAIEGGKKLGNLTVIDWLGVIATSVSQGTNQNSIDVNDWSEVANSFTGLGTSATKPIVIGSWIVKNWNSTAGALGINYLNDSNWNTNSSWEATLGAAFSIFNVANWDTTGGSLSIGN